MLISLVGALGGVSIWLFIDGSRSEPNGGGVTELGLYFETEEPARKRIEIPPGGLAGHEFDLDAPDRISIVRQADQQPMESGTVSDPGEQTAALERRTLREVLVDWAFGDLPELMVDIDQQFLAEEETRWGERSTAALDRIMSDVYAPNDPPPYSRLCRATICYLELDGSGEAALDLHGRLRRIAGSQYDFREQYGDFTFGFYSRLPDEKTRFFFLHPDFRLAERAESILESAR